jgi:hypothetical protein
MFDDVRPPERRKPKVISPLEKPTSNSLPPFDEPLSQGPVFRTPEQVAAVPVQPAPTDYPGPEPFQPPTSTPPPQKGGFKRFFTDWRWHRGKKATIAIAGVAAVLLVGAGTTAAYYWAQPDVKPGVYLSKKPPKPVPKITTVPSTLTGLQVDASVNDRPVTGVMIENSLDARPQSSLDKAGVVFEAIAEGGITRFLALYQDTEPDHIGPVRSARPYYVQWCMGFDCSLAHVGGSPEALQNIKTWGTKDLDQFRNAGAYHRISSRYAPHNVYTSTAALRQLEASKGFGKSTYSGFTRKKDAASKTPNATAIDFALSGVYYNAHFDYDAATNSYKRSQAGTPHMELNKDGGQVQIQPKVVVGLVMQYGLSGKYSQYNVIGSGQAFVFQDGVVTQATWTKTDLKTPLTFTDAAGKPLALNAGQTWITALSGADKAVYK